MRKAARLYRHSKLPAEEAVSHNARVDLQGGPGSNTSFGTCLARCRTQEFMKTSPGHGRLPSHIRSKVVLLNCFHLHISTKSLKCLQLISIAVKPAA